MNHVQVKTNDQKFSRAFQENPLNQKVREIMGETVLSLSDEELGTYITTFQCLVDSWLDEYERQSFDGRTLREILGEVAA